MRIEHLRRRLRELGAKACHERLLLRAWTQAQPLASGRARPEAFFSPRVLTALPALAAELDGLARLRSEHPGEDGSARLLVELADGQTVESVLLPRAPRIAPDELVELGEAYARATGYPIQYQWTLLAGVNDTAEEVEGIARLLAGKYAVMNLIPYNSIDGLGFARPARAHAEAMVRRLYQRGILTKLRQSAGQDVDAGCGQLRARTIVVRTPAALRRNAPAETGRRSNG